ncbi:molybdate ABC transporter substrate-binding protein [Neptunomonas antarctica]|uniref:Molybdate transport system substrate-binding protein n=1 Tax=Neptunomonas antarctica TaxID=619304 RepID=A0A1N7J4X2_9GAMM|nr:molybdate ABC transporter substrate-binding protein [Neptunomonas antarctica]SIS44390.1 molybdate transport system substrate-binding protein [Neptunomonas antarctica]
MKRFTLTLLLFISCSQYLPADTARIAVSSNFTIAAQKLALLFEQTSTHTIQVSSGSTGKLYIQIRQGAPFDLLLAADMERPQRLFDEGYANTAAFIYATGKLVLWSRDLAEVSSGLDVLKSKAIRRLAIANPKTAPYGKAAQQVLDNSISSPYPWTLVKGDNIAQTYQFAASGNADAAFVARAQIALDQRGYAWDVPQSLYLPIHQGALLLKRGDNNPAAHAFYRFLQTDKAKSVIQHYGYISQ